MRTCENCNSEHDGKYGSGRFCSAKCSKSFSTKVKRNEINIRVSQKMKGNNPWNKGKTKIYSEDTLKKMSDSAKKFFKENPGESSRRNKRPCSTETKIKLSEKMIGKNTGEKNGMYGKKPKNTQRIKVYSEKHLNSKIFVVRSTYEKDYIELLNKDNNVISFKYEPKEYRCNYILSGKKRTYQPDFLVNEVKKQYVVEVKAKWMLENEETIIKEKTFKETYPIEYLIWTK